MIFLSRQLFHALRNGGSRALRFFLLDPSFLKSSSTQTLLAGGADPDFGAPSAMEAIVLFKQEEKWRAKFEAAPGRGTAREESFVDLKLSSGEL